MDNKLIDGFERMSLTLKGNKADYTPSMEIMIDKKVMAKAGDYMDFCDLTMLETRRGILLV